MADAKQLTERLLQDAAARGASDLHVEPTGEGFEVRMRVDGFLSTVEKLDDGVGRGVVTRLMVMAQLLTYRLDVPQEGRISAVIEQRAIDMRVSVMPTTHGMRAVVRLPAELVEPRKLDELGLPEQVMTSLRQFAAGDSGMLLMTGPAGSGKTTTIYALLQHIIATQAGLSVIALEDPVERDLPGVTQVQVQPFGELTWAKALRSVLRQDPQVLVVGEIRDPETASLATAAALSGHRLIATFHAASPGGALARLIEMGIEPYQITSTVHAVVAQRLLRALDSAGEYRGRIPAAEIAAMDSNLRAAILEKADANRLDELIHARTGHQTLRDAAMALINDGVTDAQEVMRVLGEA